MGDEGQTSDPAMSGNTSEDPISRTGRWMFVLLWVVLLGLVSLFGQRWMDDARTARLIETERGLALELGADRLGHFVVEAEVNGHPVEFLVDTGASGVSLPASVADELGLERGRGMRVSTANGSIVVRATVLDSLVIGPFARQQVPASINPAMQGRTGLLGMSFLRHFDLRQRDGKLTIQSP